MGAPKNDSRGYPYREAEPATQAGRAHVEKGKTNDFTFAEIVADVLAIEAEAQAEGWVQGHAEADAFWNGLVRDKPAIEAEAVKPWREGGRTVQVMLGEAISRMKGHPERSLLVEAQRRLNRLDTPPESGDAVKPWREALSNMVKSTHQLHDVDENGDCNWASCQHARALLATSPESGDEN